MGKHKNFKLIQLFLHYILYYMIIKFKFSLFIDSIPNK